VAISTKPPGEERWRICVAMGSLPGTNDLLTCAPDSELRRHVADLPGAVTTGMTGAGFYDAHSGPQLAAITPMLSWVDDAAVDISTSPSGDTVRLADFGCSEGHNSLIVLGRAVSAIRRRTARSVDVIFSDLPTNDYRALMEAVQPSPGSVFDLPDVHASIVPGTMFRQLLPTDSLDLATTFNAIGFLSRRPLDRLPGYILPNGPTRPTDRAYVTAHQQSVFADQAATDLETFCRARARELRSGGWLLVQVFGANDHHRTGDGIYDALHDAVLWAVDEGLIGPEDYARYYQPVYVRTLDEMLTAVDGPAAPLSDAFACERSHTTEVRVDFVEELRRTGDVATYASQFTAFLRAFTEAVLRAALRSSPSADECVEAVFAKTEELVQADPGAYRFTYVSCALLLRRR
jgi:SAM dependent carboxyl methyltransferase